jgi:hypothetical protein
MKLLFCIAVAVLGAMPAVTHGESFVKYSWEENRKRVVLDAQEAALAEYILKDDHINQYGFENDDFILLSTVHRIILVNNAEAVQKHNKIYIPMYDVMELVDLKARTIKRDGSVVVFDNSNIRELKDEQLGNAVRIFAVEGAEEGSEIEYYYTRKMQPKLFESLYFQYNAPVRAASLLLTSPVHLQFDFRSYNGLPDVISSLDSTGNRYVMEIRNVPPEKDEEFSAGAANRPRLEYKLAYNLSKGKGRLFTWEDAAARIGETIYSLARGEEKGVQKILKEANPPTKGSAESRIRAVENYVKTNINLQEGNSDGFENLEKIAESRLASKRGLVRLFASLFVHLGIEHSLVLTTNRLEKRFDNTFDTWNFLEEYLIHFPSSDKYMAPDRPEYRYWMIPYELSSNDALYITHLSNGTHTGSVGRIPAMPYQVSNDDLDIDVAFSEDLSSNTVTMTRSFGGYNAVFVQPYYPMMTQEQRTRMVEEITRQTAPDARVTKWEVRNGEANVSAAEKPLIIHTVFTSSHFLEKAGNRYLFKVGDLIGPQVEMYRDDHRVSDVENDYNRGYDRKIVVRIPSGYTVKNPQDIVINHGYPAQGRRLFTFESDYSLEGNVLTIHIIEYYSEIFLPKENYEEYRKVINAAADFNKVTLLLEKK